MPTQIESYGRERPASIPMRARSLLGARLADPANDHLFNKYFMGNVRLSLTEQGGKYRIIIAGDGITFTFSLEPDAVVYSVRGTQEATRVFRKLSDTQGREKKGEPIWINVNGFCEEEGRRLHVQTTWNKEKGFREHVDETSQKSVFRKDRRERP